MKRRLLLQQYVSPSDSERTNRPPIRRIARQPEPHARPTFAALQVQLRAAACGHSLSQLTLQPALIVGQPEDEYEQEADAIAAAAIQRQPEEDAAAPNLQRQPEAAPSLEVPAPEIAAPAAASEAEMPQPEATAAELTTASEEAAALDLGLAEPPASGSTDEMAAASAGDVPEPSEAIAALSHEVGDEDAAPSLEARLQAAIASGGEPLPEELQTLLRSQLGMADPEAIEIHRDSEAHDLCTQLAARAFTTSNHIFFGAGEYDPDSDPGRELIVHEAVHTLQQGATTGGADPEEADAAPETTEPAEAAATPDDLLAAVDAGGGEASQLDSVVQAATALQRDEEAEQVAAVEEQQAAENPAPEASDAEAAGLGNAADEVAGDEEELKNTDPVAAVNKPPLPARVPEAIAMPEVGEAIDRQDMGEVDSLSDEAMGESAAILEDMGLIESLESEGVAEDFFQEGLADAILVQADTEESQGTISSMLVNDYSDYPDWAHLEGDDFGTQLANTLVVAQTMGAAYEVYDTFASVADETNGFGVAAVLLEGLCQVLEVITNILDLIGLTLSVIALVLLSVGAALAAIPFTAAVGATLIGWAANVMNAAIQIDKIILCIVLWRMLLRGLSIGLRIASVFYEGGNWDDAWNAIQSQVAAFGMDALRAAFAAFSYGSVNATSSSGLIATTGVSAAKLGTQTLGKSAFWIGFFGGSAALRTETVAGGLDTAAAETSEFFSQTVPAAYSDTTDAFSSQVGAQVVQAQADTTMTAQLAEQQEERAATETDSDAPDADLPPLPEEAPAEVADASTHSAFLTMGEGFLAVRELELLDAIAGRQAHAEHLHAYQTGAANHAASLQGMEDVFVAHNELTAAAVEHGDAAGQEAAAASGPMAEIGNDLGDQQGMIQRGGKLGESQGVDASATQAGPGAQQEVDAGPSAATDSSKGAEAGSKEAAALMKDNEQKIGAAEGLKQETSNMQDELAEAQSFNTSELDRLFGELEAVREAQAGVQESREEEAARREAALAALIAWTEEHQEAVEAFFLADEDETADEFDSEADGDRDEDEAPEQEELLAHFYEWLEASSEVLLAEIEADEAEDQAQLFA